MTQTGKHGRGNAERREHAHAGGARFASTGSARSTPDAGGMRFASVGGARSRPNYERNHKYQGRVLLAIAVVLFAAALAIVGFLLWRHFSAVSEYDHLRDVAGLDTAVLDDPSKLSDGLPDIDWDALHAINPQIIAWLYVPGTELSYPIVQAPDNEYYLNHTADGNSNSSGAVFLDYQNSAGFTDISTYVYGHNMLGNTMFSEMTRYVDPIFLTEHPRVLILTPTKSFDLTVVACIECAGTEPIRRLNFSNSADFDSFKQYVGSFLKSGKYESLLNVNNLYFFSTCRTLDISHRIIVVATDNASSTQYFTGLDSSTGVAG